MENENFYQKLKQEFPEFNTANLSDDTQKSLESLLSYTSGSLDTYRIKIAELKADVVHSELKKSELLAEVKVKFQKTLTNEFQHVQDRVAVAQQALDAATCEPEPKDSSAALLRHLEQREIRDNLSTMPLAKRTEHLINGAQGGDAAILRAIEAQPIVSDLMPLDVMNRANTMYVEKIAPQQTSELAVAAANLDGAAVIRNLTEVVLGHIEQAI